MVEDLDFQSLPAWHIYTPAFVGMHMWMHTNTDIHICMHTYTSQFLKSPNFSNAECA